MENATRYDVKTYQLIASNGRPIRKATMVTDNETGKSIKFMDRLTKKDAIKNALYQWGKN